MQRLAAGILMGLSLLAGCDDTTTPTTVIVTPSGVVVVDDVQAVAWEGGILWTTAYSVDPTVVVVDVNAAAATAARSVPAFFTPAGCASASAAGNVLTLQLNGCAGPFGLTNASGTVVFAFTQVQGGVQIAAASNLQSGSASLTINAQAVLTGSGASRTLTVTTNGGGTGPNGTSVTRQGQYTIAWTSGEACASIDGTVASGTGNVQRTTFRAFNVCRDGCPRSGTVTLVDPQTGGTVTTTYNGTATVTVSANGQQSSATLSCQ